MDLEAVQLLNLSPIPELSEIELSTMLEQLSGLSDLNGDLTDRNVEDILKEAEDLLDRSYNSGINQSIQSVTNPETNEPPVINEAEGKQCEEEDPVQAKHYNSPVKVAGSVRDDNSDELSNSPVDQVSNRVFSPGISTNHIKSTIDSLKEFSTLIEKQLSNRSDNSTKERNTKKKPDETITAGEQTKASPKSILKSLQSKGSEVKKKNVESLNMDKSIKMLNCFERLYQDRPARLSSTNKKPKIPEKAVKPAVKKKQKDVKPLTKDKPVLNQATSKAVAEKNKNKTENPDQHCIEPEADYSHMVEDWLRISKVSGCTFPPQETKSAKNEESDNEFFKSQQPNGSKAIDESLILRMLQEMEEIKTHVKKAEGPERVMKESQAVVDTLESEVEKVSLESAKNAGIRRLEEQFSVLKNKYDHHMEKLEAENMKLREALSSQQRFSGNTETPEAGIPITGSPPSSKQSRPTSVENSTTSRNSRSSMSCSPKAVQASTAVKEAFSQTEKELRSTSIQCVEQERAASEDGTCQRDFVPEDKRASVLDSRKTENKENVSARKRLEKLKPFSDVNAHQLMRQKKIISDHETQLLATLRGLQAEVTLKDKEARKLKNEIDVLKTQAKKLTRSKGEGCKRCHTGTQTIGLGPVVQRPYNPEVYEVPNEFAKENEELKAKVKALEEDFRLLKEKRINDLQALHKVHEEEMAKLVSKLETQSALTRHLHSLLVNR